MIRAKALIYLGRSGEAIRLLDRLDCILTTSRFFISAAANECQARLLSGKSASAACVRWSTVGGEPISLMYSIAAAVLERDSSTAAQVTARLRSRHPQFTIAAHRERAKGTPSAFRSQLEQVVYPALRSVGIPDS
jgi:hypothetical protein